MILPQMPAGYYLLQDGGSWYVLKDEGTFMKRLLDQAGNEKRYGASTAELKEAAEYARKHQEAGLKYDQEVPEVAL